MSCKSASFYTLLLHQLLLFCERMRARNSKFYCYLQACAWTAWYCVKYDRVRNETLLLTRSLWIIKYLDFHIFSLSMDELESYWACCKCLLCIICWFEWFILFYTAIIIMNLMVVLQSREVCILLGLELVSDVIYCSAYRFIMIIYVQDDLAIN